jgi:spermidine synthase
MAKLSKLNKLRSFVSPVIIEEVSSVYNPVLQVMMRNGRYQLLTENAVYSYADLYDNFSKVFDKIKIKYLNIKEVLILGFGLGSIPYMLEKKYEQNYGYTAIEIDPEVLRLAEKYVTHELKSPIDFVCTDAAIFVEVCEEKFDLICMDVFSDDITPDEFYDITFLESLKNLLSPNGILIFNKLAASLEDKAHAKKFLNERFLKVFTEGGYLDVTGNYMLINQKRLLS